MRRAHVIVNPEAGRGAARHIRDRIARAFHDQGWTTDIAETTGPRHATALAMDAAKAGATHVVVAGGDGAVHEVANGLLAAGTDAALAVVPLGSGNDFAKLAGTYRHSPERAVARIVTGRVRDFDVGRVAEEWFVNSCGLGFSAAVVQTRDGMPHLRGFLSYLVPVLKTFASYRAPRLEIAAAEFRETGYVMMVEACNGTTAGGDYRFAPDADPADGALDVCLIREVSLPRFLLAIPRVMRGRHTTMREVAMFRTAELVIRSPERPLVLHLDGELRTPPGMECTIRVEPGRLPVVVAA